MKINPAIQSSGYKEIDLLILPETTITFKAELHNYSIEITLVKTI